MTRAEYNRQYYQKNKEKLKQKAMERKRRKNGAKLSLVKPENSNLTVETMQTEQAEMLKRLKNTVRKPYDITDDWLKPHVEPFIFNSLTFEVETKFEITGLNPDSREVEKKFNFQHGWKTEFQKLFGRPANLMRLIFMIGLTSLFYLLQVEFFKEHDVSPQFSWGLALASECSLLALMLTKYRSRWINFLKGLTYCLLFSYLVISLGFHQYQSSRQKLTSDDKIEQNGESDRTQIKKQLDQATASLEKATRGRSWDNMKLFGEQVTKLQDKLDGLSSKKSLGTTDSQMYLVSAILIIMFRIILIAVNSLNAIKLRENYMTVKPWR